jgi:enoyl-CoA hydratase
MAAGTGTRTEIDDGVAWITLDDGKVNALSGERLAEIDAALDLALEARAIPVLRGRAGIFSAGFDLETLRSGPEAGVAMVLAGARLVERLLCFPLPVVSVCTGHAYPMGAFLLLSSDVRFGVAGPFRIGMNEVAIGLTVPWFAIELARHRLSPAGFARVTTAPMFDPEEAVRLGYLDRVVPAQALDAALREELARLRTLDMPSYVGTKARVNGRVLDALRAAIDDELAQAATLASAG